MAKVLCKTLGILFVVASIAGLTFGAAYLAFGALGMVMGDPAQDRMWHVGALHLGTGDHGFHMIVGTVLLAGGLFTRARASARATLREDADLATRFGLPAPIAVYSARLPQSVSTAKNEEAGVKRSIIILIVLLLGVAVVSAQRQGGAAPAQGQPAGGGRGPSPEQQAALTKQLELEKSTPQLQITEDVLSLSVPGHTIGEAVGVAKNSKGHLFVFTRSGNVGPARGATASQLYEFDQNLKFVKQWGPDNYAASFAHTVRVDKYDNVWMTDEGSNMIVKFTPAATVSMVLGRKPEALDFLERFLERGEHDENRAPVGNVGTFNRPTDVTWDSQDNIYISDGYNNSRVVKVMKDGTWGKAVGTRGSGMNQFNTVHAITSDAKNNIYVADRGNRRIQVYDTDLNFIKSIANVGAPWTMCVSPAPNQFLFSGDGNGKLYKLDMNGNLVGWAQTSQGHGQAGCLIHELHCESENVIYKGDCSTWTVEKITIRGGGGRQPSTK